MRQLPLAVAPDVRAAVGVLLRASAVFTDAQKQVRPNTGDRDGARVITHTASGNGSAKTAAGAAESEEMALISDVLALLPRD